MRRKRLRRKRKQKHRPLSRPRSQRVAQSKRARQLPSQLPARDKQLPMLREQGLHFGEIQIWSSWAEPLGSLASYFANAASTCHFITRAITVSKDFSARQ